MKPNVVIIMADQLRVDALGKEYTPNINKLAQEGVVFNRAYCASPLCVPARGAFFTGRYPNFNGSLINPWEVLDAKHANVKDGIENLYEMMENDWDSWHTGKQHLYTENKLHKKETSKTHWRTLEEEYPEFLKVNSKKAPGGPKFKGVIPEMACGTTTRVKRYSTPKVALYEEGFEYFTDTYIMETSLEAIKSRDKNKPLLLNAMFVAPHPPFNIPEPYYSMYKDIELPENVGVWCANQSPLQLYNLTGAIGTRYSREDWKEIWPVYLGLVSMLDYYVGRIVEELKNQGIYDETMIIFTSDHGEMLGSHCLWQKMCMYEESTRIPLYIKFPKNYMPAVREVNMPVSAVDVLPTLCDYLELEKPQNMSGISLMPAIEGKAFERGEIYIQFDGNGARSNFQRSVVEGDYKLIVDIFKDEFFIEFYNISKDSQEMDNLAFEEEYASLINSFINKLCNFMSTSGDLVELPDDLYESFIKRYLPFKKKEHLKI